ncbi:MMPL family transporter [Gaiella sp.]|uniref:MMPL family transporter n=1 Tax=Gaiella sp. TaxID=2663207 RepID=UPI0032660232
MSRALYLIGGFAARRPFTVIASWLLLATLLIVAAGTFGQRLSDSFTAPGLDSQKATDMLASARSDQAGLTAQVVVTLHGNGDTFRNSAAAHAALAGLEASIAGLPHVLRTSRPAGDLAAGRAPLLGEMSADGRVAIIRVQYPEIERLSADDLANLKGLVADSRVGSTLQIEAGGDLFAAFEAAETNIGEIIGLLVAAIILLLAFGSIIAMGLPIGIALFGIAIGVSSMGLLAYLVDVPSWAPVLASMVGLGVGIDYALFLVTRHRGYLADGLTVEESAARAVSTAGQAVVFAGGTVVVAILGLAVAGVPAMTAAGMAVALVVLIMVLASITLLPALLRLAGHRINGIRRRPDARPKGEKAERRWERWGLHVCRHPWPYLVGVGGVLVALTVPVLGLQVGMPDDGSLPGSRTERRAYDLAAQAFGPGFNGPLLVAVDASRTPSVVGPLRDAIAADHGVAAIAPIERYAGVATLVVFPTTGPQDAATSATMRRLRENVLPRVLGDGPAVAHVGGRTASVVDIGQRVQDRLPLFIAAVVTLSFLLLTLVFRSIIVPLKAALLNLLGVGAAYGVLVMVFQWGWGAGLIGLESEVPIVSLLPMFMFAILFGLSMDYEVFLLSRVREEYLISGDNRQSIARGISSTARVITSAALIMVSVFLGFVLGDDPGTKMFGLGLAIAIFIDATLVRMVLVPATMSLLGDANWWLPRWLDHRLPSIDGTASPVDASSAA